LKVLYHPETSAPTAEESRLARESIPQLAKLIDQPVQEVQLRVATDSAEASVTIPATALPLLANILQEMAQGNAVTLVPVQAELTTQQAADLLNVSRPFLIDLIDKKTIPCRMVGSHRRIPLQELLAYKQQTAAAASQSLDELTAQAQELNMGY
jgi:excisionase family DNA binding protein